MQSKKSEEPMEPLRINLGGFVVSAPAQRALNFLLGAVFLVQSILFASPSRLGLLLRALQSGFGGLLIGLALFPKSVDRPYFLIISEKGLEGQISYFKSVFIPWEHIPSIHIQPLDVLITHHDGKTTNISLASSPLMELRAAKTLITQWALQHGVLVRGD